jgi:hypothetical protein
MTISTLLSSSRTRVSSAGARSVARFEQEILDVRIPQQTQDNWCWAAVALGIAHSYLDFTEAEQCDVARRVLSRACCPDGFRDACDVPRHLPPALGDHFAGPTRGGTRARSFPFVRECIRAGNPVAVRIKWAGSRTGHFVVIVGYRIAGEVVDLCVCDPWTGRRRKVRYGHLMNNYYEAGTWDQSYETTGANRILAT